MNEAPDLEAIRQEHESWLGELEALVVQAIASNNWDAFYAHLVEFQSENDQMGETGIAISTKNLTVRFLGSTDSLDGSGADLLSQTAQTIKEQNPSCHNSPN